MAEFYGPVEPWFLCQRCGLPCEGECVQYEPGWDPHVARARVPAADLGDGRPDHAGGSFLRPPVPSPGAGPEGVDVAPASSGTLRCRLCDRHMCDCTQLAPREAQRWDWSERDA